MTDFGALYLDEIFRGLRGHKRLADDAIAQLTDEQFFAPPDSESNSAAVIMKHMAGNFRSRFTNFLTTDGEKPDRNRDQEFVIGEEANREEVLQSWEQGWHILFDAVNELGSEDLTREITIRGQPHTVLQALSRASGHAAYHVGQITFLAKHWKGAEWKSLSVPKGESEQFNAKMFAKYKSQK